jgi:preprotein translocase subunit YajC
MNYLLAMAPPSGQDGGGSMYSTLIMFGAIFAIFYFMIIRPQQKRAKEKEKLISGIQKGDKVVTLSGSTERLILLKRKPYSLKLPITSR